MPPQEPQQPQVQPSTAPQPQPQQVTVDAAPPMAAQPSGPLVGAAPANKRIPTWLKIVGAIILVFIIIIAVAATVAFTATKAPQKVSDQFVDHLQAGDTSAAYALTGKTFKDATTEEQLDNTIKQISSYVQGQEKVSARAIESATGLPKTAVLVYTVATSKGDTYIKVELQQSDGAWQVINFRSDDQPLDTKVE